MFVSKSYNNPFVYNVFSTMIPLFRSFDPLSTIIYLPSALILSNTNDSEKLQNLHPNVSSCNATSFPQTGEDVLTELPSRVSKSSGHIHLSIRMLCCQHQGSTRCFFPPRHNSWVLEALGEYSCIFV